MFNCPKFYSNRSPGEPQVLEWDADDQQDHFQENCRRQPPDWPWRNQQVRYRINSLGFRAPEFDQILWEQSLVIFGCSHTYGLGLDASQTVSCQLSQRLNRPVINMGVTGSSIYVSWMNLLALLEQYPHPLGVINYWTSYDRIAEFTDQGLVHHGSWCSRSPLYRHWSKNSMQMQIWAEVARRSIVTVLEGLSIWHWELTNFDSTAHLFECPIVKFQDRARDLTHPGPRTVESIADMIAGAWREHHGSR